MKQVNMVLSTGSIILSVDDKTKMAIIQCGRCSGVRQCILRYGIGSASLHKERGFCRSCAHPRNIYNPTWKGGKTNKQGYKYLHIANLSTEDKELAENMTVNDTYVAEHRLVMARSINRSLERTEIVHHKNGIKDDNRIENLELTGRAKHALEHQRWTILLREEIKRLQLILQQNGISY